MRDVGMDPDLGCLACQVLSTILPCNVSACDFALWSRSGSVKLGTCNII